MSNTKKASKMRKLIFIGIIVAICAGCGGASPVDKAISQVEQALEKVEKNKGNMTEADWENLEKEMEEPLQVIVDALENNKIGMVDRIKVMTLVGKWTAVAMEAGLSEIEKSTGIDRENFINELENAAQELEKNAQELENMATEIEQENE